MANKPGDDLEYDSQEESEELSEDELLKRKENYMKLTSKTTQEREELTANTVGQSKSKLWRQERLIRLTSSNFGVICKMKETTHCANLVKNLLYSNFSGNQATRWGDDHEAVAIQEFEEKYNLRVQKCGMVIDSQYNFLAASPDGLVAEDATVEVKCPASACLYTVTEAIHQKKIKFAEIKNGKIKVKRNDNYYYQIQGQLRITQRKFCYFIIWTPHELTVEQVVWDETFWKTKMEQPLISFFNQCFLPEIIDPQFPKNRRIKDLRKER